MRIGILTLPLHTNYGGILQAYALQTVLERMGHKVTLIDKGWPPNVFFLGYIKRIIKESIKKVIGRTNQRWHWIYFQNEEIEAEHQLTFQFVKKYIHRKIQRSLYDIEDGQYDGFVVGSDQVWREQHYHPIENAYLDFTQGWNVKRVAYAASFGTDDWEYSPIQTKNCSALLKKFDAVGVRESSGVLLCKKYLNSNAQHVLDPTLLLSPKDYIDNLHISDFKKSKGDFLVYILDMTDEKKKIVDYISKKYHLIPFYVNSKCDDKLCELKDRIQPPVEMWLRGFYDAKFVFTDSFHACAFSINFNKPFLVFGNQERGMSRFVSLLSEFGLDNRLIDSYDEVKSRMIKNINWQSVNAILKKDRTESVAFLNKILRE